MLETLTRGFRTARLKLQGKAELTEENISNALRDVRVSLLEADVEMGVVRSFLGRVRERSMGEVVNLRNRGGQRDLTPSDHFINICNEELVALMGPVDTSLDLEGSPAVIMMVGLQGSGKTTTAGKIAKMLLEQGKKPMMVAADIYRPAAIDQLVTLGRRLEIPVFSIKGMRPVQLCQLAIQQARSVGRDVVILDTAGRLAIDDAMMAELEQIKQTTDPANILFVCDAMIGQDAVRTAAEFDRRLSFTGFVLTKLDGDARGGAALSIKEVTGKPIKFLGMGEGLDKLEEFRPEGLASRILGFGDVVGLVQDMEQHIDEETAEVEARKMLSGNFGFDDFLKQLEMIQKMGSLKSLFERLPFFNDLGIPAEALDDRELVRVKAVIQSMTPQERADPDIMDESRMRRIAKGCGRTVQDVRDLYERFLQARAMMGNLGNMMPGMMGGGGAGLSRSQRRQMARGGGFPGGFPGMGGMPGGMPGGFPGMGGGMPGGFPGMGHPTPDAAPQVSADEKIARRKKARDARRARKKQRKKK